jgi:hypothetical protein
VMWVGWEKILIISICKNTWSFATLEIITK